jgi:hypothetical protein
MFNSELSREMGRDFAARLMAVDEEPFVSGNYITTSRKFGSETVKNHLFLLSSFNLVELHVLQIR